MKRKERKKVSKSYKEVRNSILYYIIEK